MYCKSSLDVITTYLVALTPIAVAFFMAFIGLKQLSVNKEKIRLDLYQRRFTVYERTLAFYHDVIGDGNKFETEEFSKKFREFVTSYRESQFLFARDSGIFELLGRFHEKAICVIGFKQNGAQLGASCPEEFLSFSNEMQESLTFLTSALIELEEAISPYLAFRKVLS